MVEPTSEYGYRDLGIIQDSRRLYLDAKFTYRTNDLTLATRLYHLRREHATNSPVNVALDGIFTNLIRGDLNSAALRMARFETNSPNRSQALESASR